MTSFTEAAGTTEESGCDQVDEHHTVYQYGSAATLGVEDVAAEIVVDMVVETMEAARVLENVPEQLEDIPEPLENVPEPLVAGNAGTGTDDSDSPNDGMDDSASHSSHTEEVPEPASSLDLPEPGLSSEEQDEPIVTYRLMEGGSKRGKAKLFDSLGFSYVFKNKYANGAVIWRCPLRNKAVRYCAATVKQRGSLYQRGPKEHVHDPAHGAETVSQIIKEVKEMVSLQPRQKTHEIVCEVLKENVTCGDPRDIPSLEKLKSIARKTRCRIQRQQGTNDKSQDQPELVPFSDLAGRGLTDSTTSLDPHETDLSPEGLDESNVTYRLMEGGSKRGRHKLFDSLGYSYVFKRSYADGAVRWRCPVRNEEVKYCPASVKQLGSDFWRGPKNHVHGIVHGAETISRIVKEVKEMASLQPTEKTDTVVREVLRENVPCSDPCHVPGVEQLKNIARRKRRKMQRQPQELEDVDFDTQADYLPSNFLVEDVRIDVYGHHLILATPEQLRLLADSKCWYADTTYQFSQEPSVHLLSIHAYVQSDCTIVHIPLVFAAMSRRRKRDYKSVLRAIVRALPSTAKVKRIILNFESALWRALKSTFPGVAISGCTFHWRQAVWQKVQELELETSCVEDSRVRGYMGRLMALPMLPLAAIRPQFEIMELEAFTDPLRGLCRYLKTTWMGDGLWAPSSWCVYRQCIRTNEDAKGWHNALSSRLQFESSFHKLLTILHDQAQFVTAEVLPVSGTKLRKVHENNGQSIQAKLFRYWSEYRDGARSTSRLLSAGSRLLATMDT